MISFLKSLLNIVLPPRCIYCGKICQSEHSLCDECFKRINFITKPYCACCGKPFEDETHIGPKTLCPTCLHHKSFTRLNRSAIVYEDFSKQAILAFKFMDKEENAKVFAKWLKLAGKDIFESGVDIIIPVPLYFRRFISRRYNQSAILAKQLSLLTNIPTDFKTLVKNKNTKPQASLEEKGRIKNIKNAFSVKNKSNIKGKRILMIDDVMTTGATLNECAKILIKNGALSVDTLTIARVLKNHQ